jgi:hypothetical protein
MSNPGLKPNPKFTIVLDRTPELEEKQRVIDQLREENTKNRDNKEYVEK